MTELGSHSEMEAAVEGEVALLASLDLAGLRQFWRAHWGPEPKLGSADVLRRVAALPWHLTCSATRRSSDPPSTGTPPCDGNSYHKQVDIK